MTIELSIENPCVPQAEADSSVRAVWNQLSLDAASSRTEPLIAGLVLDLIDGCDDLGESLARLAASRIATPEIGRHVLEKEIRAVLAENPHVLEAVAADLVVSYERNPAYPNYLVPYLFAKGFLGLQVHRVAHEMWHSGRVMAASCRAASPRCSRWTSTRPRAWVREFSWTTPPASSWGRPA